MLKALFDKKKFKIFSKHSFFTSTLQNQGNYTLKYTLILD